MLAMAAVEQKTMRDEDNDNVQREDFRDKATKTPTMLRQTRQRTTAK
jgi:hypothetical protein